VHPFTIKAWHRAGLLISRKANDNNQRLFETPTLGDPRLVNVWAAASPNESPPNPRQEVRYETQALS
jgi:hypothetical protein